MNIPIRAQQLGLLIKWLLINQALARKWQPVLKHSEHILETEVLLGALPLQDVDKTQTGLPQV